MKDLKTGMNNNQPEWFRKPTASATTKCNRCQAEMQTDDAEHCWYCFRMLCFDCWNEFGECGHGEDAHVKVRK